MSDELEKYILAHIEEEPKVLKKLYRDTNVNVLRPRMMSGHLQGRMLKMFTQMIGAKKILELGTFTGYSAQCFAEGMANDGVIYTIDNNDELEEFTTKYFEESGLTDKIHYIIGNALQEIKKLEVDDFDMVFVDADKREYLAYFEAVLPKVRKGGFILADNTLWDGKVIEPLEHNDEQTRGIMEFNDFVATDSRVETVIIPLRDGLTILRKK